MTKPRTPVHAWQLSHIERNTRALHTNHLYAVIKHSLQCHVSEFASSPVATIREEALDALISLILQCESEAVAHQALSLVLSDVGHSAVKGVADTFMQHALHHKQSDFLATSAYEAQRVAEFVSSVFVMMTPAAATRCPASSLSKVIHLIDIAA